MEHQAKIEARLASDPAVRHRRQELLSAFLGALDRGGVDEATTTLTRPFAELERAFAAKLTELERLL
jgi:hypothetical protein